MRRALEEARSEVEVISAQLQEAYPDSNRNKALQLDELRNAMVEDYRSTILILVGAIMLVLLIAFPWMMNILKDFTLSLMTNINYFIR